MSRQAHRARTPWRPFAALAVVSALIVSMFGGGAAWAYWTAASLPGGNGLSAAATVPQGATPTTSVTTQNVTVSWAARTLSSGGAVSGYIVKRYDTATLTLQTTLSGCTGTIAALTCTESNVPVGSWRYTTTPRFATNWAGAESALSPAQVVETTPPTNVLSVTASTGNAVLVGTTVYYRGANAGSLTITNALTDAGSGPASSSTAALGGTTTGFSHTPSTVTTPSGGPYVSSAFSWSAGTTSSPTEVITGRDVQGNATTTTLTFVNNTGPTASISYADGFVSAKSVALTFSSTSTGPAITTRQLQRAQAILTGGTCGTFGAYANLGANNPTSIYSDTSVSNSRCYQYRFVVGDALGNSTIATSASIVKVDYATAVSNTAGLLSYWRLGEGAATNTSLDSFTGTSGALLSSRSGELGASWTKLSGGGLGSLTEVLSSDGRIHRDGTGYVVYGTTTAPASADYAVQADVFVRSLILSDNIAITARTAATGTTFYAARSDGSNWTILKYVSGAASTLGTNAQTLVTGQNYRVKLEVSGSTTTTIKLSVNGVLLRTVTDSSSPITATGVPGIYDGDPGLVPVLVSKSNTTGLHLDNFQVSPLTLPRAADSKGTNTGDFINGVATGAASDLANDTNTSVTFDGVNDYIHVASPTSIPVGSSARSIELWFKTSSANRQTLYSYGSRTTAGQAYGLWLNAGGTAMTAWAPATTTTFTMPSALNNGAWHHVVQVYDGTTMTIYIDGTALTPQTVTRSTVMNQYWFTIGAVLDQGDANYGGFFSGSMDEFSLYTTALDATTVTNHFQLGTAQ